MDSERGGFGNIYLPPRRESELDAGLPDDVGGTSRINVCQSGPLDGGWYS
jgi:hypothetical protein